MYRGLRDWHGFGILTVVTVRTVSEQKGFIMALVKVRRDGNSLAVTIPADEARALQIEEGMYVTVEPDATGQSIQIQPVSVTRRGRPEVLEAGKRVLKRNRGLYKRLAAHDKGSD